MKKITRQRTTTGNTPTNVSRLSPGQLAKVGGAGSDLYSPYNDGLKTDLYSPHNDGLKTDLYSPYNDGLKTDLYSPYNDGLQ